MNVSEDEDLVINLAEPINIIHAQKKRRILDYCEKVMKGKTHLTLGSLNLIKNIFSLQKDKRGELGTFGKKLSVIVSSSERLSEVDRQITSLEEAFAKYSNYLEEEDEKLELTEEELLIEQ